MVSLGLKRVAHHRQDRGLQRGNGDWCFSVLLVCWRQDFHTIHLLSGFLPQADLRRAMGESCYLLRLENHSCSILLPFLGSTHRAEQQFTAVLSLALGFKDADLLFLTELTTCIERMAVWAGRLMGSSMLAGQFAGNPIPASPLPQSMVFAVISVPLLVLWRLMARCQVAWVAEVNLR